MSDPVGEEREAMTYAQVIEERNAALSTLTACEGELGEALDVIAYMLDEDQDGYRIAPSLEKEARAPDTGDWHGELRGLLHECSRLLPEGSPEYGGTGQHKKPNVSADEQLSRLTTPSLSTAREALRESLIGWLGLVEYGERCEEAELGLAIGDVLDTARKHVRTIQVVLSDDG